MINIFILCFNESILLPHTIKHYKTYLPNSNITIYDNYSTDNSVEIARQLGCNVVFFDTQNMNNVFIKQNISNTCWKQAEKGCIIMIDMDEWLCVTEDDLIKEEQLGTTILTVQGYEMIGESQIKDLTDINLHNINKCVYNKRENKNICFNSKYITEMQYTPGAHKCNPIGVKIKYSSKIYVNKHMNHLGMAYSINKHKNRYMRSIEMRKKGMSIHYSNNTDNIVKLYNNLLKNSSNINTINKNKNIELNYNFDWKYYLSLYPDLKKANINNEKDAYNHWINHGKKEERICNPIQL
jgi:hypothetical protein